VSSKSSIYYPTTTRQPEGKTPEDPPEDPPEDQLDHHKRVVNYSKSYIVSM
jgi:hypothetical protein